MKIFFLTPYPINESPSQRFRFEQYFHTLTAHGHSHKMQSFLDSDTWKLFFRPGGFFTKMIVLLRGFIRRISILPTLRHYDFIFIHREAAPIGPPILEWFIARILKRKIVYDFDDAIWLTDNLNEGWFQKKLRWRSKVKSICHWSYKISCGNEYLAGYARAVNNNVIVNPTTIDTDLTRDFHVETTSRLSIGWTGSHSTLKYLENFEPVLKKIEARFPDIQFIVISDVRPQLNLRNLIWKRWNKETEIADLLDIHIGIMPLPNDKWTEGKCGFKILQYMALGIPAVASAIGVNTKIIDEGISGFCCNTEEDWLHALTRLLTNSSLREKLGVNARQKIEANYSLLSNRANFESLFQ